MTFTDQYKHPLWQKKRLEVLGLHNFACEVCRDTNNTLHVHHAFYRKNHKLWEYESNELSCLCETCHQEAHMIADGIKESVFAQGIVTKLKVLGYAHSVNCDTYWHVHLPLSYKGVAYIAGVIDGLPANRKITVKKVAKLLSVPDHYYDADDLLSALGVPI